MKNPWVRVGFSAWDLGFEASSVIGLRVLNIVGAGPAAEAETRLMFREQFETGWTIQGKVLTGALGVTAHTATARTLAHYGRKVRSKPKNKAATRPRLKSRGAHICRKCFGMRIPTAMSFCAL